MKLSLLILSASVATAGAFSAQSVRRSTSTSTSTSTARHATIEKQETELVKPKTVAELMSQTEATMDMYGINVQKTYG
jgi:hypothetical protein